MTISTRKLLQIAAWGGIIVSSTGFYLQTLMVDRVRGYDYYKDALKILRTHPGAVHYLGEPIKDKRFKLSDAENNFSDGKVARFQIPVTGSKDRGTYYIWAERDNEWNITKAELELKSKPDTRMVIDKTMCSQAFIGFNREKFFYHNTLLCLVRALQGQNVTIDLRNNDSYVCGLITSVDGYMNISLSNAIYCDPVGNEYAFENMFVQGRNIRYVHVPEMMPIIPTIKNELAGNKENKTEKAPVEKSRKAKKAFQQHMQTVALLDTPQNVAGPS